MEMNTLAKIKRQLKTMFCLSSFSLWLTLNKNHRLQHEGGAWAVVQIRMLWQKGNRVRCWHLSLVLVCSSTHPAVQPYAFPFIPSSILFNVAIHTLPIPSFLRHLLTCSPTLRQGAVKELKQWDLLAYPAVNNAIRVTDCQELRLPPMCVSLWVHTHTLLPLGIWLIKCPQVL